MKRFAGIDISSERHVVAVVDEHGAVMVKPSPFGEEAAGYRRLIELLGSPQGCLIAMEATGHYWRNLFAYLVSEGFHGGVAQPGAYPTLRRGRTGTHQDRCDRCVASRASRLRNILQPAKWPRKASTNCARWCACATGCCRTSATGCANFIASWI